MLCCAYHECDDFADVVSGVVALVRRAAQHQEHTLRDHLHALLCAVTVDVLGLVRDLPRRPPCHLTHLALLVVADRGAHNGSARGRRHIHRPASVVSALAGWLGADMDRLQNDVDVVQQLVAERTFDRGHILQPENYTRADIVTLDHAISRQIPVYNKAQAI